ncbi:hypothetical protein M501DRAFT_1017250 [Patellaria atrata CBS 101060]|uniref:M protein repeat protein n=1 Tax=Patellaria atrata CBS 101060 TaxID=1346257 RepID=A0A9P4VNZ1_9PEZI|nr:hypothetical protein M501DRAFT_1017250 [Patellaria atrata CBS 101060]
MTEAEDKEKAEKLAAAKKRFEQLKKQKKGAKGGASKKKEDKTEPEAEAESSAPAEKRDDAVEDKSEEDPPPKTIEDEASEEVAEEISPPKSKPSHDRKVSLSVQSKARSESFRLGSNAQSLSSPILQGSGGDAVQDVYRKQAQRIEELEKENKRLQTESNDVQLRWRKTEEQLEELMEANGEFAELRSKADQADLRGEEIEKLKNELTALQRQHTQLQSQTSKPRRMTTSSPSSKEDLSAELASKSAAVESLELEISKLNNQLTKSEDENNKHLERITALETNLERSERAASSSATELSDLKKNLERASETAVKEGSSRTSAETRIAQLEAELATAQRSADSATKRAETLEKKLETLTTLHREADARNQAKAREKEKVEREAKELRSRITNLSNENARLKEASDSRRKAETEGHDDGVDELEDAEHSRLMARIRELEEECFDLRRGVWRDRRREMQPGLDDSAGSGDPAAGFHDVDLDQSPRRGLSATSSTPQRSGSTFQDVINSGISAFTGGTKDKHGRKQSVALLSEDGSEFGFDEDAWKLAQEEEAKRRLERVKEVKRGLNGWKGWKVDIVDLRAGWGGVFDV